MLPELRPEISTLELGAAFSDRTSNDSNKHPSETHLTRMTAEGRSAKFVAILTRLQRQQDLIMKDNSDLKSQVMQQRNTILELRKQLNTATEGHGLNFQTSLSERLKPQKMTEIDQEPAAERSGQPEIEVAIVDTIASNEQLLITGCAQTDPLQDIKDVEETQSDSEEVEQSENAALSPQEDNFNQSDDSLRMKQVRSARIGESNGKRIKLKLESIQESPTNVRNIQQPSKLYSCGECKKQFSRKGALTEHLRIHTGEKPYVRKDSGFAFNQAGNLKAHQRLHTDEKPYVCNDCGFASKYAWNLKTHQRLHTDEKRYVCNDCGVAFNQGGQLKRHQRIHMDERPFICDICKKSFRQKGTLSRHMDIHSGKKSHKCNHCQKEFRRRSHLMRHLKVHS